MREILEQGAVSAPNIEKSAGRLDHICDQFQIDSERFFLFSVHLRQLLCHALGRGKAVILGRAIHKAPQTRQNSGSSSRKASWPLSDSISAKLTLAATELRACTIFRLSVVGYSQSVVKEITQNRDCEPRRPRPTHRHTYGLNRNSPSPGYVEIRVGIKPINKCATLMPQIALHLEIGVKPKVTVCGPGAGGQI